MPRRIEAHWVGPHLPEKTERELWLEVARAIGRFAAKRAFADLQAELKEQIDAKDSRPLREVFDRPPEREISGGSVRALRKIRRPRKPKDS